MHAAAPRQGINARRPGKGELLSKVSAALIIRVIPKIVIADSMALLARCRTKKTKIAPMESSKKRKGIIKYDAEAWRWSISCDAINEIIVVARRARRKNFSDTRNAIQTINGQIM
ncbi:MADS-box transcription factor [Pseudomonas sp. St29]|nr:MADS-box transcription factor [Pseudomonas sp. St29]